MARALLFSISSNHYLLPPLQSTWIEVRALHCGNCTLHLHFASFVQFQRLHIVNCRNALQWRDMHSTKKTVTNILEFGSSSIFQKSFLLSQRSLKIVWSFPPNFFQIPFWHLAPKKKNSENEMSTIFWSGDILQTPLQVTQCKSSLINFLDLPKIVLDPFWPFPK